ncbi:MAG: ZIP family metal transporter [Halioglobus sp.]|nr:ZIP family metal transporter [Halioglobus sp.]
MSPTQLLIVYCLGIAGFSWIGGLLPGWIKMTHTRTQLVMSLVSGLMLGVAFYHLLPHSAGLLGGSHGIDTAVWWLMVGLVVMLLLLRVFHFHQHEFTAEDLDQHDRAHHGEHQSLAHGLSWVGLGLGLAVHTLIDGVALGAVMLASSSAGGLAGIGVFLAILLHKPLDAMSIVTVMAAGGWSRKAQISANLIFALMCPLGALLFFFGADAVVDGSNYLVAAALAFSAGAFICIALSDLLPEVHFHSHDRVKLTLAFLLGLVLAYAIGSAEPVGVHVSTH